ncbi:MAG TPA: amidohydrolase family protein, partial [bacterium]|nr:amidohydrolase family protein [bacterium]
SVSGWYKGKRAEADREKVTNAFASGKAVRYIMHFCEGIDAKIHEEFEQLKAFNMLREEMVGIHSTALRGADWDDIAAAGMKAVWSPLSNLILYNETTDIKGAIEHGVAFRNLSFAPDWAPSGTPGMIEELKVVAEYNEKQLDGYLTARQMYEMMTINPANISSYDEFVGEIKAGLRADITVVKMTGDDPYVSLQQAKIEDVNLVMIDGQPLYGTLEVYKKFDKGNDYEIFVMNDVEKAIDITEEGIDKGDQTLRQLMELLIAGFKDIRQNVPFEFPDDVDAYCHLSPMFWPQPTSYTNLMYGCVLGEGTDSTKDRDAFRNSDHYRNRNADAKNQYNTYKEQVFGITTTSRGGRNNQGGQSSRNNRSDRNNRNNQNSRNDRNSSAGEGDDGGE